MFFFKIQAENKERKLVPDVLSFKKNLYKTSGQHISINIFW